MAIEGPGTFYDGLSNKPHKVVVRLGPTLEIVEDGRVLAGWPYEWVRRADSSDGSFRLRTLNGAELARLIMADDMFAAQVRKACPRLDVEDITSRTATGRIVVWSLAAAVSLILTGLYGIPFAAEKLTPLVPLSFENYLGEATDKQVGTIFNTTACDTPDGTAAFRKLIDKIVAPANLPVAVRASVVRSNIPNAIALPGGKVYLFRGLLDKAQSPDEVAGVLAHELGHVKHRDSMRILIQAGGTSFLLGLLFGDVTGSGAAIYAAKTLTNASYTRDAERNADGLAIEVLQSLGRSPKPLGELLLRVTGPEDRGLMNLVASHPLSEERLQRMAAAAPATAGPPILSEAEWQSLKQICGPAKPGDKTNDKK